MRVLVLGAGGMLGHQLARQLSPTLEVFGTLRNPSRLSASQTVFPPERFITGIDTDDFDRVTDLVGRLRPTVVINCVGVIKQLDTAKNPVTALTVNALLPHRLADLTSATGSRLIHFSTDCVFSGRKGMYKESDVPDAEDLYGRSKLLGELDHEHCLTIRTSIIGREIGTRNGLVEWFLQNPAQQVSGFRRAVFSGLTTLEMARVIERILTEAPTLSGLYHVSVNPISKFDLLTLVRDEYRLEKQINPVDEPVIDRSLDSSRFRRLTEYEPPSWPQMIHELAGDNELYQRYAG